MRNFISSICILLLATLFIAIMPTEAEGAIYEDTVRLHILACSDSEEDQALKLLLRDAVLNKYGDELSVYESVEEAEERLNERLDEIRAFSDAKIKELGYEYKTEVTLTREWYDTRDYEEFSLPCGYYTSLRIIIGEGEGKNWWCVMFPPMCLDAATSGAAYNYEENVLITKKYKVKFKILELISEISR